MKNKSLLVAFIITITGIVAISCGTTVKAMEPSDPVVPQMPVPAREVSDERMEQGKIMFQDNCAKCHKLFSPSDFTKAEWGPILMRMQPKAHLDNEQIALVSDYVTTMAR